ncbi:MAG TPA: 3'-5' exonuclease [Ktedonobacterales bacterium]|nr:3'-5' exonuclease [Ktedonobacterales bacterium]
MADVTWTARQAECIAFAGPQLLVSGPPGSGKTLVLLKRACRLSLNAPRARVMLFTYNNTLAQAARAQLRMNEGGQGVDVSTFHSWAFRQLIMLGRQPVVISEADRSALLGELMASSPGSGPRSSVLDQPVGWWGDEFDWIKGNALLNWDSYRDVERAGRGMGLRLAARESVWERFERYQQRLVALGQVDYRDFALLLLRHWQPVPHASRIGNVLIDEAQDFRPAELRVLTQVALATLTVAADRTQKIYKTAFVWRDLGFDVRGGGRARILTKSYRTTRQVAALADSLRRYDPLVQAGDPDDVRSEASDRDGPVPVLVTTRDATHETEVMLRLVAHLRAVRPHESIGVLARVWGLVERLADVLERHQVPVEIIREKGGNALTAGVKLTTFHSSKGLEFGDVILAGLSEGLFPPPLGYRLDAAEDERESDELSIERRLLYVAMTRTRNALYLLAGQRPSRFLAELDPTRYVRTAPELVATLGDQLQR